MFTTDQFRSKAADCAKQADETAVTSEIHDLRRREQSFLSLAQNEEWLADNLDKIIRSQDGQAAQYPGKKANGRTAPRQGHRLNTTGAAAKSTSSRQTVGRSGRPSFMPKWQRVIYACGSAPYRSTPSKLNRFRYG